MAIETTEATPDFAIEQPNRPLLDPGAEVDRSVMGAVCLAAWLRADR